MKARHSVLLITGLVLTAFTATGCGKGHNEAAPSTPVRDSGPNPPTPVAPPATTLTAFFTYESCLNGLCHEEQSACPQTVTIPLSPLEKEGAMGGSLLISQEISGGVILTAKIEVTQASKGGYAMKASISDSLHTVPLAEQELSGAGRAEQSPRVVIDGGEHFESLSGYRFSLSLGGDPSPSCKGQPKE